MFCFQQVKLSRPIFFSANHLHFTLSTSSHFFPIQTSLSFSIILFHFINNKPRSRIHQQPGKIHVNICFNMIRLSLNTLSSLLCSTTNKSLHHVSVQVVTGKKWQPHLYLRRLSWPPPLWVPADHHHPRGAQKSSSSTASAHLVGSRQATV